MFKVNNKGSVNEVGLMSLLLALGTLTPYSILMFLLFTLDNVSWMSIQL